ncbi:MULTISPECIES: Crp/Fnr family transcriptional regulator [unclassified Sphingobacterium]|uniref:Crp/Fnr family transcriptional regulator n=1 Tax=unclassified Sphingobacterium TaxID=2609468 RepID=UPI0025DBC69E|nr:MULTISPECIES: Crp/Fnr family transcriptional regulator [unclassified Sphingobacterium]
MKSKKATTCDHSCLMCRYVLKDWLGQIDLHRKQIKVKKGEQFIAEGEAVHGIYFVQSGLIKVHRNLGDKDIIVRFAKEGDIVGHRGVSSEQAVYPISATALEPTQLCFVDLPFFMSTLRINSELSYQLMLFYADELQLSEQKMCNLVQLSVKNRLAWSLLLLHRIFGAGASDGYIGLALSKKDLASYVGTTYETFYRMLGELVAMGAITVDGKKIFIKDFKQLNRLASEQEV